MSRRKRIKKRLPGPDPVYNSYLVSLLSLRVLKSGKKQLAERIVYRALDYVKQKTKFSHCLNYFCRVSYYFTEC